MKALDILIWASRRSLHFSDFGVLDLSGAKHDITKSVVKYFHGKSWEGKIEPYCYLFYYSSNYAFYVDDIKDPRVAIAPDVVIRLDGDEVRLYKIEE